MLFSEQGIFLLDFEIGANSHASNMLPYCGVLRKSVHSKIPSYMWGFRMLMEKRWPGLRKPAGSAATADPGAGWGAGDFFLRGEEQRCVASTLHVRSGSAKITKITKITHRGGEMSTRRFLETFHSQNEG